MEDRLLKAYALIDAANAEDPSDEALTYGLRMTETLAAFQPDAPEVLKIAARAQHIERWTIPRQSYPEGRSGYLAWRSHLQKFHASRAGDIMRHCGYTDEEISRVGQLLRKERLKQDPDAQALEDVICIVFIRNGAEEFLSAYDDAKAISILAKTARKMSPEGVAAAMNGPVGDRLKRLLASC